MKTGIAVAAQATGSWQHGSVPSRNHSLDPAAAPRAALHLGDAAQTEPRCPWHLGLTQCHRLWVRKALSFSRLKADEAAAEGSSSPTTSPHVPQPMGHQPAQTIAPTSCAHNTEKQASQRKLSFAFSKSFSGLVGKDNTYSLESRCAKPYQVPLRSSCSLALM